MQKQMTAMEHRDRRRGRLLSYYRRYQGQPSVQGGGLYIALLTYQPPCPGEPSISEPSHAGSSILGALLVEHIDRDSSDHGHVRLRLVSQHSSYQPLRILITPRPILRP